MRGYPGPKLRSGRPKSWKNKHFGADIHDPKARTSMTLRDFQKLRSEKLWAEFSLPKSAVFCGFVRPPNAGIARRKGEHLQASAVFCENLRFGCSLSFSREGANREKLTVKKRSSITRFFFHRLCPLQTVKNRRKQ